MSRIATYAPLEAGNAINEARRIIAAAGRRLDVMRRSSQCDDDDRRALDAAQDRLNRIIEAM